ncbi:B12-binding domain-containing radical SAM protein [Bradyrhizobium sp. HKCCYLS3077]|uniref:B12-binding domain-containing radical SAM protein n=1 Tax=Bradyrhizobium sp. HKCCYLS3077 TaxID=3420761 RepID=UPI003EBABBE2
MTSPLLLVVPPVIDPRSTYLGVSMLAGRLAANSIAFEIEDHNVRFFDWFVSSDKAQYLYQATGNDLFKRIERDIDWAKALLRGSQFYVDAYRNKARNLIDLYCRASGLLYPKSDFRMHSYSYDGVENSAAELLNAIANPERNPFDEYYHSELFPKARSESQLIAISITNNHQLFPGLRLARLSKQRGKKVIVGGACVTKIMQAINRNSQFFENFDVSVFFEGEDFIEDICRDSGSELQSGRYRGTYSVIGDKGIVYHEDAAPIPSHSWSKPIFSDIDLARAFRPRAVLPVITGKGCSWGRCVFCTIPDSSGAGEKIHRDDDISKAVSIIEQLQSDYSCDHFLLTDENFSCRRQVHFAEELLRRGHSISWISYSRFEVGYTLEVCRKLKASGCKKLLVGLEAVSNETLKRMKKGTTREVIERNLRAFALAEIPVHLYCMAGFPGQDLQDAIQTLAFVIDYIRKTPSSLVSASFSEFMLSKGSGIFNNPTEFGVRITSNSDDDLLTSQFETLTPDDVQWGQFRKQANKLIVQEFDDDGMVGWEEFSLLLADRPRNNRKGCRIAGIGQEDWTRYKINLRPRERFSVCSKAADGALLVSLDTFKSITVSDAIVRGLSAFEDGATLAENYIRFTKNGAQIPPSYFLGVAESLQSAGLISVDSSR